MLPVANRDKITALAAGCISVEADVWLYDDILYVSRIRTVFSYKDFSVDE